MVEGEAHGQWLGGFNLLDQAGQLQRLCMWKATLGDLVPGVRGVEHPLKAEQDVVSVQRAAWLEITGAVELHLRA
ncbi:hypothetical protein D3C84_753440 [compost metagenome]